MLVWRAGIFWWRGAVKRKRLWVSGRSWGLCEELRGVRAAGSCGVGGIAVARWKLEHSGCLRFRWLLEFEGRSELLIKGRSEECECGEFAVGAVEVAGAVDFGRRVLNGSCGGGWWMFFFFFLVVRLREGSMSSR